MLQNFYLSSILSDFQLKLLGLIQCLNERAKGALQMRNWRDKQCEPIITLQYSYIVALFGCSNSTVVKALDKLCELKLIEQVSNRFGECNKYRYNEKVYKSLVNKEKNKKRVLFTGRTKQRKEVTAEKILDYMAGKAITKAEKPNKRL